MLQRHRLTRNFGVVVQQVLLPLLRSHVIINAEHQILLVIIILAVTESRIESMLVYSKLQIVYIHLFVCITILKFSGL